MNLVPRFHYIFKRLLERKKQSYPSTSLRAGITQVQYSSFNSEVFVIALPTITSYHYNVLLNSGVLQFYSVNYLTV